jgi:hypothetical protein
MHVWETTRFHARLRGRVATATLFTEGRRLSVEYIMPRRGVGESPQGLMPFSPLKTKFRTTKPMPNPSVNSSVHSFVTSSESPPGSNLESTTPAMPPTPIPDRGVGLSDPDQSAGRRRMLELVNRMHNTGLVCWSQIMNALLSLSQRSVRHRLADDRRRRFAKCRKVFVDRVDLGDHTPPCKWDMHQVSIIFPRPF